MRLEVRSLVKEFGGVRVLDGLDLTVPSGGLHVILGTSGAGKSVLLRCLNGLERPTSGTVSVGEHEVTALDEEALAQVRMDVGYVFQYSALFDSMSVLENVAWPAREHRGLEGAALLAEAARCMERVGLADLVDSMDRLAPSTLSGGRRKRVALARALALAPEVLLHDEPTSGLDPASARAVAELIVKLGSESRLTQVVVTHDVELGLRMAHGISILAGGRFVFEGTPRELDARRREGEVRRYLEGAAGPEEE